LDNELSACGSSRYEQGVAALSAKWGKKLSLPALDIYHHNGLRLHQAREH
jgi:hypothetical protein